MTIYRLTDGDKEKSWYFATIDLAMAAGDKMLAAPRAWKHHLENFNDESPEGWMVNDGTTYLSIVPVVVLAQPEGI